MFWTNPVVGDGLPDIFLLEVVGQLAHVHLVEGLGQENDRRILEAFAGKILTFIMIVLCRIDQLTSIEEVGEKVRA